MPQLIHPKDEQEWLQLRTLDVTSTEIVSLFYDVLGDLPGYCATPLEYWHQKKDCHIIIIEDNERTEWGDELQDSIARRVAKIYGVKVRRLSAYARHDRCRMGSSYDYEIVGVESGVWKDNTLQSMYEQYGPGILEIKNVDNYIFSDPAKWDRGKRTPDHIELQCQHQLEVINRGWTALAALVGGNKLHMIPKLRDKELGQALVLRTDEFWKSIEENRPPQPDFNRDSQFISKLFSHAEPGTFADLREDSRLTDLCVKYKQAGEAEKTAKEDKDAIKAEILTIIGETEKVAAAGFTISAGIIAECEMAYTRSAYRNFKLTARKS